MKRLAAGIVGLSLGLGALSLADARQASNVPSFQTPNTPGSLVLPERGVSTPPAIPERRSLEELEVLWREAGEAYGIPWQLLGAINSVESNFGQNMGPSYAGAVGWMQFLPSTWDRWGLDADGDGIADPWDPEDAIYGAARYLAAADAHEDLRRAVYAYNHSYEYVDRVMGLAQEIAGGQPLTPGVPSASFTEGSDVIQVDNLIDRVEDARAEVAERAGEMQVSETRYDVARAVHSSLERRVENAAASGSDAQFAGLDAERAVSEKQLAALAAELGERRAAFGAANDRLARRLTELAGPSPEVPSSGIPVDLDGETPRIIGTPGIGTHNQSDWQSRNAIDIAGEAGTPVLAVGAGRIVRVSGSDPALGTRSTASGKKIYGYGVTLETSSGQRYYYAHVDDVQVAEGDLVRDGSRIGTIAPWFGGPAHLHFASESGHPADTLGAAPPEGVVLVSETHSHDVSFYTEEIG